MHHFLETIAVLLVLSVGYSAAQIKLIRSTATTLEWNIAEALQPGKKYSVEVLLLAPTGNVRVIDEPLGPKDKTYRAANLKSNKRYQIRVYPVGKKGQDEEVVSIPSYTNLRCYTCNGAASADSCTKLKECPSNARECFTQVRYYNGNGRGRFIIQKGCKVSTDVCVPNQERINLIKRANSKTEKLTLEQVLDTMPGLKFFGDVEELLERSPSILKRVKKKFEENKKLDLENALKERCLTRDDEDDFCRCCCRAERCNHAMLDCGMTEPPPDDYEEPLPPDIATPPPETTFPVLTTRILPPACRVYNGGCDHVCIALNKTAVRCECHKDYKLQDDGKTCKTHLGHAVADAGPDITVTLPQTSVAISAKDTKGSVKSYKWWDPIAIGEGAGLTVSDTDKRDLIVTDLQIGQYKFILMVTGMDGRRTSDVMTLTVLPNPSTTDPPKKEKRRPKPRAGVMSFSRFTSNEHREEYKDYVKENGIKPSPTTTTALRFSTTPRQFKVIKRPGGRRRTTTAEPVTTSKPTTTIAETPAPVKPSTSRGRGKGTRGKAPSRGGKRLPQKNKGRGGARTPRGGKGPARLRSSNQAGRGRPGSPNKPTRRTPEATMGVAEPTKPTPTSSKGPRTAAPKRRKPGAGKRPTSATPGKTTRRPRTTTSTTPEPVSCSPLDVLSERQVIVSCSDSYFKDSACEFQCEEGRSPQGGSISATCGSFAGKAQWVNGTSPVVLPCCEEPCPANAYADVVFLIHSSTKIGRADWTKLLTFANSMVSGYAFSEAGVCVGAVRYHRVVDAKNEISLDCSRTKASFRQSLMKMPFAGAGTNTAAGIDHLRTSSFKSPSNRPRAQDVAVIITDSRSTGDVAKAARSLKASGVQIFVVGVKTKGGTPNLVQMKTMASFPARIPNLQRIPAAVPAVVKNQLQNLLCVNGCERFDAIVDTPVAKPKSAQG